MFAIIDRFEGQYAVIEIDGNMKNIKLSEIPDNAKEGDVLKISGDKFILDKCETERRKKEIQKITEGIWIE